MRFGLYGIHGTYNFGCEAIVRGTYKFIRDCQPEAEIFYFTYSYDYDIKILSDLDIRIVKIQRNVNLINRCINKALNYTGAERHILTFNWEDMIEQVDAFISIGGDIYTIPESLRLKASYPYYNSTIDFLNRAIQKGKQVSIYGASMGPWGNYQQAINYFSSSIRKYKYIICREHETINYLKSVGISDAIFQPDPAFLVRLPETREEERSMIGINFSPLSFRELYGTYSPEVVQKLAELVEKILEEFDSDVLLIPHVLSRIISDNDELMLKELKKCVSRSNQNRIKIADTSQGFLGIKVQLRKCKFIVSARMHCAINAVMEGVPAIFLSYSKKSQGMAEYVYGTKKWVLPIRQINSELLPLMHEMDKSQIEVASFLKIRMKEIRAEYCRLQDEQQLFR